jgi:nifR3 family TIM-barrel protein
MSRYHPVTIGGLELPGNVFLAPVAGYTDRAFRSLCVEQGANFTFTELISAEALRRHPARYGLAEGGAQPSAASLIRRAENERHYAIQLFGADPQAMYEAAVLLSPHRPAAVDINAGCPVPNVVKNGAGAALMKDPSLLGRLVAAVVRACRQALGGIPVTVKMRSGWDFQSINYLECARAAVDAGAAMISLHPRTRSQNYSGKSDWNCIGELAGRLPVPVAGSGDLYTPEDAEKMLRETGCAAVLFARGAMGNPFIFSAARAFLQTGAYEAVPVQARIAAALRHLELLAADIGERAACLEMRKQFCAYTKMRGGQSGMKDGGALRNALVRAETLAEYRRIVAHYQNEYIQKTVPLPV